MTAKKFDTDKPRFDLLPAAALTEIVQVLNFGGNKYGDQNWRSGIGFKWGRLSGAALRHLFAFIGGQDKDPETGLSHIAHAGCCVLFLLEHVLIGLGQDDRHKYPTKQFQNPPLQDDDTYLNCKISIKTPAEPTRMRTQADMEMFNGLQSIAQFAISPKL